VDGLNAASASGTSHRGQAFLATTIGTTDFTATYLMTELFDLSTSADSVGSYVLAELNPVEVTFEGPVLIAHTQAVRQWANGAPGPSNDDALAGSLVLTLNLMAGSGYDQESHVFAGAYASTTPVPVPAALPLFGSALLGVAVRRRRLPA